MVDLVRWLSPLGVVLVGAPSVAQVAASVEALTAMQVRAGLAGESVLAGTNLANGVHLSSSWGSATNWAGAAAFYHMTTVGSRVTFSAEESSSTIGPLARTGSHESLLRLSSAQPATGTLVVDAVAAVTATGGLAGVAIDADNDGTIDWQVAWAPGVVPTQSVLTLPVTVTANTEVRLVTFTDGAFQSQGGTSWATLTVEVHFKPDARCVQRNGTGVNPIACTCASVPQLGTVWNVDVASGPSTLMTFAFASTGPVMGGILPFGEVLVGAPVVQVSGTGTHSIPIPNETHLLGRHLTVQGARLESTGGALQLQLTNAQDGTLGR